MRDIRKEEIEMSVFKLPQHLTLAKDYMSEAPGFPIRFVEDTFGTIEALRPFLRFVREERIIPVGSFATSCTLCDTSWLTERENEHHEETCILHGIPLWLSEA